MNYLKRSLQLQQELKKLQNHKTITELKYYILQEAKFFIAVDSKYLLKETKERFNKGKQKFLMVEIEEIEFIKQHSFNLHFVLNKGTNPIGITLSTIDFKPSGVYLDHKSAALDIQEVMADYEKRRQTYTHTLNQTNKGIAKLLKASELIIDKYPETFV